MENQNKIEVVVKEGQDRTLTDWSIGDNGIMWGRDEKGDKYGIPLSNITELIVTENGQK